MIVTPQNHWTTLQHGQEGLPWLLFKFTSSDSEYEFSLTDLTHVWVEKLSAGEIASRAEETDCSISPGKDTDQLRILVNKIETALHNGPDTSVDFEPHVASDDLVILLRASLPTPLPAFIWRTFLSRAKAQELGTAIVWPLLQLASYQQENIRNLSTQLQHKDHVIGKLLDRMESANIHLDSIFLLPNLRPSKAMSPRDQFARHVPGLAIYQPDSKRECVGGDPSHDDLREILESLPDQQAHRTLDTQQVQWWRCITNVGHPRVNAASNQSMDLDGDETEDEDFETQGFPDQSRRKDTNGLPLLQQQSADHRVFEAASLRNVDEGADTADDEEASPRIRAQAKLQSASPHPPAPHRSSALHPLSGMIGEFRSRNPSAAANEPENPESEPLASSTNTRYEMARVAAPSVDSAPAPRSYSTKRRLGVIGGFRESSQAANLMLSGSAPSESPAPEVQRAILDPTPASIAEHESLVEHSRSDQPEEARQSSPMRRETSEERANGKREKLKMQLKSKAPAKKRRRF